MYSNIIMVSLYYVYKCSASVEAVQERLALHSTTSESWRRYVALVIFALQLNRALASLKSFLPIYLIIYLIAPSLYSRNISIDQ